MTGEIMFADVGLRFHDPPGRHAVSGSTLENGAEELARDDFSVARKE
jgi:hypothetical protein